MEVPHITRTLNLPPRMFGCVSFAYLHKQQGRKLNSRMVKCVLIEYSITQKRYKCFQNVICVKGYHLQYPSTNYSSFEKLSSIHIPFLTSLNTITIPFSKYEALIDKKWKQAMDLEMKALEKNNTCKLVTLPPKKKTY